MEIQYTDRCSTSRYYGISVHPEYGEYVLALYRISGREYDPFVCMEELLCALLTIGYRYAKDENISLPVVDFCCRYGHLGFKTAVVEKIYEDNTVKLYKENVLGKKALAINELYDCFKPFKKEFRNQQRRKLPPLLDEPPESDGAIMHELDYSYCEKVEWYGIYGLQLCELLQKYERHKPFDFSPGNAKMVYRSEDRVAKRVWTFDALKSAIDVGFTEMLTDEKKRVRLCKRCAKPFIAADPRSVYCSASCRNVMNVKLSRHRKRETGQPCC
ncbi:MAG: hypothetical protein EOM14_06390 [Clostridia bacterium]|nr:hypothetical protein [Clostridia bacterium]